jgi:demethylmenaquinone methyltransferase / 2-methoxy-6-polyprenyl-1,4-benzoquinol methylase
MGSIVHHNESPRDIVRAGRRRRSGESNLSVGRGKLAAVVDTGRARATLAKRRADVAAMFDGVAARYDLVNDLLTAGLDRGWRRAVLAAVAPRRGEKVLDLAAGTGTSSKPFADAGAVVVAADLSLGMLQVGKQRQPALTFVNADALALPFGAGVFDAVTISFGLRNMVDPEAGLREMLRVTRPGGRLVVCEFSHPTWAPLRTVYVEYLMKALPPIARAVSSSPDAYVYLADSIRAWPQQAALADVIARAGWQRPEWRNLSGGIVTLHRARA